MKKNEIEQFVKDAIIYAVENFDPNLYYSKYIGKNYIQHIDDEVFDFDQYVHHMQSIKQQVKSLKVTFQDVLAQNDKVAIAQTVHGIKKDNTEFEVKVIAIFKIEDNKIVYVNELTRLMKGNEADKNIGSLK